MQRIEDMGLRGTFGPVIRTQPFDFSALVTQARESTPDSVAPVAQRPLARPQESRPHDATLARRGGFSGVLGRLSEGDPFLWAELRSNPATAQRLRDTLDRLIGAV